MGKQGKKDYVAGLHSSSYLIEQGCMFFIKYIKGNFHIFAYIKDLRRHWLVS